MNAAAHSFTVHWCKSWEGKPIYKPAECRHTDEFCSEVLSINQRLEPRGKGGGQQIALDASICMICGVDVAGNLSLAEGLSACMDEHGWNREVGLRLHDLAEFHQDELWQGGPIPIWFLYAFGWTGKQIVDALNRAALEEVPASVDTRPQDEDPLGASLASGAVPKGDAQ
jgi:hypothetical protein